MSVAEPSIQTLLAKHGELKETIRATPAFRTEELARLKRQKLRLKDRIAQRTAVPQNFQQHASM